MEQISWDLQLYKSIDTVPNASWCFWGYSKLSWVPQFSGATWCFSPKDSIKSFWEVKVVQWKPPSCQTVMNETIQTVEGKREVILISRILNKNCHNHQQALTWFSNGHLYAATLSNWHSKRVSYYYSVSKSHIFFALGDKNM